MKLQHYHTFYVLQAYVDVGSSQSGWPFAVDSWRMYIIFYALLIFVMILQGGSIVQVKIAFVFDLGSLMKSMFVG